MSIFDTLFGSNQSTTSQQQTLAQPAANVATNLFTRAEGVANTPYTYYTGNRVAGFTPDQMAAFENARGIAGQSGDIYSTLARGVNNDVNARPNAEVMGLAGSSRDLAGQGVDAIGDLAVRFPNAGIEAYMNPYVQQVLDPALEDVARRSAMQTNALRANAARTGSFGGSRNMLAEQELERNTMNEMGRLSANERARAFNEAAEQFRKDQAAIPALYAAGQGLNAQGIAQSLGAGEFQRQGYQNLRDLMASNQGRISPEVNSILATGGLQQGLDQAGLDVGYQNWQEARDWPLRGIQVLQGALGTGPGATGQTTNTTATTPRPNPIGQVLGSATGLLGAVGGISGIANLGQQAWNWLGGGSGSGGVESVLGSGNELLDISSTLFK